MKYILSITHPPFSFRFFICSISNSDIYQIEPYLVAELIEIIIQNTHENKLSSYLLTACL